MPIYRPVRQKPPFGTLLNRSHPISKTLLGAFLLNENSGAIVNNGVYPETGTVDGATWGGGGLSFVAGETDSVLLPNRFLAELDRSSVMLWFSTTSTAAQSLYGEADSSQYNSLFWFSNNTDGVTGYLRFYYRDSSGAAIQANGRDTSLINGAIHSACFSIDATVKDIQLYSDGEVPSSVTTSYAASPNKPDANNARLGLCKRSSNLAPMTGTIYLAYQFSDVLSPATVRSLHNDPYQMFHHKSPARYFYVAGGGGSAALPMAMNYYRRMRD